MSDNIESVIIHSLLKNPEYFRKVLPHILPEYFENKEYKTIFGIIKKHSEEYNNTPSNDVLTTELDSVSNVSEDLFRSTTEIIRGVDEFKNDSDIDWLIDTTEKYCINRSIHLAAVDVIDIITGDNKEQTVDALPSIMQKALSVTFDKSIGHDYLEDAEDRYDYYHQENTKHPFPLAMFNHVTEGGSENKTLNFVVGGTGSGKTLFLHNLAASFLKINYDVIYISLEMAEEKIAERIDAKLMNINMNAIKHLSKEKYLDNIEILDNKTTGKLIVKEYPPASVNVNHIRTLLEELNVKKSFKPTIIFLDYLNLLTSSRMKASDNSYGYMKSVTEELRGLMVEYDVCGWTATQTNRGGQNASDFELNEVSESHGIAMTADFMVAMISTDELEEMNQVRFKLLKNRYGALDRPNSFVCGIYRDKMTLFDIDLPKTFVNRTEQPSSFVPNNRKPKPLSNKFKFSTD